MKIRSIGDYLKATGKTEMEMAEILGISQAHLNELKNGKKRPSPELALRIERATGIPFKSLLLKQGNAA